MASGKIGSFGFDPYDPFPNKEVEVAEREDDEKKKKEQEEEERKKQGGQHPPGQQPGQQPGHDPNKPGGGGGRQY